MANVTFIYYNYPNTSLLCRLSGFFLVMKILSNNVELWKTQFWEVWEPLPWDAKLTWIAFVSQTIAVITVIELFLLKK
jgi:hypothetical protein